MICGTLSILLLNDKGINLFQILFTLKRVLMKQMQIRQKEAFLLSTLTPVPKKNLYITCKKLVGIICREKIFSQISSNCSLITRVFSAFNVASFTHSMRSTCLFTNCGLLVGCYIMALSEKNERANMFWGSQLASVSQTRTSTLHVCHMSSE